MSPKIFLSLPLLFLVVPVRAETAGEAAATITSKLPALYEDADLARWRAAWKAASGRTISAAVVERDDEIGAEYLLGGGENPRRLLFLCYENGKPEEQELALFMGSGGAGDLATISPDKWEEPMSEALHRRPWRERIREQTARLETRTRARESRQKTIRETRLHVTLTDAPPGAIIRALLAQLPEDIRPAYAPEPGLNADYGMSSDFDTGPAGLPLAEALALLQKNAGGRVTFRFEDAFVYESFTPEARAWAARYEGEKTARTDALERVRREIARADSAEIFVLENKEARRFGLDKSPTRPVLPDIVFPIRAYEDTTERVVAITKITGEDLKRLGIALGDTLLPEDKGPMCHFPAYGVRFRKADTTVFETSLCFGCQNYGLPVTWPDDAAGGSNRTAYWFASLHVGKSPTLKALLETLVAPKPAAK